MTTGFEVEPPAALVEACSRGSASGFGGALVAAFEDVQTVGFGAGFKGTLAGALAGGFAGGLADALEGTLSGNFEGLTA